jgi:hypothetical protein
LIEFAPPRQLKRYALAPNQHEKRSPDFGLSLFGDAILRPRTNTSESLPARVW